MVNSNLDILCGLTEQPRPVTIRPFGRPRYLETTPMPSLAADAASRVVVPASSQTDETRQLIRGVIAKMGVTASVRERRSDERVPFPQLIVATPVEADGVTSSGTVQTVVGKQLSESGISFFHPTPLPHRWVVVELESPSDRQVRLLVDLDWCRFTRQGWYESGGRFVRTVS
jgi:hypothetical protein